MRVCIFHSALGSSYVYEPIDAISTRGGCLVVSYESLREHRNRLQEVEWNLLVCDEAQKIRNPDAQVTLAVKSFPNWGRIAVSGSPIQNSLRELWALFDFVVPGQLGTLPVFEEHFVEPILQGARDRAAEQQVEQSTATAELLRAICMPYFIRRRKQDFQDILQLPDKKEEILFCELSSAQYQVYVDFLENEHTQQALRDHEDLLEKRRGTNKIIRDYGGAGFQGPPPLDAFFCLGIMRKICNHPDLLAEDDEVIADLPGGYGAARRSGKLKVLDEIMKQWKAEGRKALVFVQTVQMLRILEKFLKARGHHLLELHGSVPIGTRQKRIEAFGTSEDINCMLLTTRVGGVGLNLIAATRVVIFDPDWNPMTDAQARERCWRIGQQSDVTIYRLVLSGTIEEKIYQRQVFKQFVAHKVMVDPKDKRCFQGFRLRNLFEAPKPPPEIDPEAAQEISGRFASLLRTYVNRASANGDFELPQVETLDLFQDFHAATDTGNDDEGKDELGESLYAKGLQGIFDQKRIEDPGQSTATSLDGQGAADPENLNPGVQLSLEALRRSQHHRAQHDIKVPTWTGKSGAAGQQPRTVCRAARPGAGYRPPQVARSNPYTGGIPTGAYAHQLMDSMRQFLS